MTNNIKNMNKMFIAFSKLDKLSVNNFKIINVIKNKLSTGGTIHRKDIIFGCPPITFLSYNDKLIL